MAKKIVVVDDDRKVQVYLEESLTKKGYELFLASDAESGLELIKTVKPDLLLVDILLPRKDGVFVCETLRADPETNALPIIMMTGIYRDFGTKVPPSLVNDFIKKPFPIDDLMVKIDRLLG